MEKFVAGLAVFGALLAANVSMSEAQTANSYFKAGGELRLSPVPVSEKITSIVWKYDKNLLAEWVKGTVPLTFYSKFRDRSELNTTTGVLVIQRMTAEDKAVYSVEINNKVQGQVYQAVEIQEVPQPTVEVQPLVCGPLSDRCRLKCVGSVDQAGPVNYYWKKGDGGWESGNNTLEIINNEETQPLKTFSCKMKNPVSEKESSPISNMFYKNPDDAPSGGGNGGVIAGVLFVVVVAVVGSTAGVFMAHKRKKLCFSDRMAVSTKEGETGQQPPSSSPPPADGDTVEKV